MPNAIDLFCGAGGMSEGIISAGFDILFSNDINPQVRDTYVKRHEQLGLFHGKNTYFYLGDIKDITSKFVYESIDSLTDKSFKNKDIDVIFGGPPCQGFSRAGKRNPDDPRNFLFKEYVRVINEIKPKYVVMENVTGFTDTKLIDFVGLNGNRYDNKSCLAPFILKSELEKIGYNVLEPKILDASDFGVPQKRQRIIFLAYRKDVAPIEYPEPIVAEEDKVTLIEAIGDLIRDPKLKKKYNNVSKYQTDSINGRTKNIVRKTPINNEVSSHSPLIVERFSLFQEGEKGVELKNRIRQNGINLIGKEHLLTYLVDKLALSTEEVISLYLKPNISDYYLNLLLTKKNMRTRLSLNKPSLTVLSIPDDYIHPIENRSFSVRELARLQSFDDSFEFVGKRTTGGDRRRYEVPQYTQVGNAVPPLLSRAIASEVMKALKKGK